MYKFIYLFIYLASPDFSGRDTATALANYCGPAHQTTTLGTPYPT